MTEGTISGVEHSSKIHFELVDSLRLYRDLSVVFAIASIYPTLIVGELVIIGSHQGDTCWLIDGAPGLGDIPNSGGGYCTPSYIFVSGIWMGASLIGFGLLSIVYVMLIGLPGWLLRRAIRRRNGPGGIVDRDSNAADSSGDQASASNGGAAFATRERLKRHGLWVAVLAAVTAAILIGARLIDGQIGAEFLCASKVASAQFGDVLMVDGGYCRPRWGSAIGVFLTLSVVLFVALSIAYFVFFFIPVSLHRAMKRQEYERVGRNGGLVAG